MNETHIVLDVAGVGYYLYICARPVEWAEGDEVALHTYLAVRETALDLYGFVHADELAVFELLLLLPKIGPKSAAQVLAQASLPLLFEAVLVEDASHLSKLSGIGKKTAETVVFGLKGKLDFLAYTSPHSAVPSWQHDTIDALVGLGYPHKDARESVLALPNTVTSTEEALREALKQLSS